ncbi:MAG: Histidine triad protein [Mycoplasmataceae bacterium RV_VA103A]|nr:MAG: Histidine triad protein [Mycoplasmataceae bacterium RV_VA103A]
MEVKENCLFCQIIQRKIPAYIIAEDNHCLAFLDINPASEGHALIITKKHLENITKLEQNNWNNLFPLFQIVTNKLKEVLKPQGFNFITNMNEVAYQSVFHFHLHIIPKYEKGQGFIWTVRNEKTIDLVQVAKKLEIKN